MSPESNASSIAGAGSVRPRSPAEPPAAAADEAGIAAALGWLEAHGSEPLPWTRGTDEPGLEHGRGIDAILAVQGADPVTRELGLLVCSQPMPDDEGLARLFGGAAVDPLGGLLESCCRLLSLPFVRPDASRQGGRSQAETLRRMTMAMARDVRVVMVRLASALQTLRVLVASGRDRGDEARGVAEEVLAVLAPLANRLGLYRIKWEMEDLAFRCAEPDTYRALARSLEARRAEREAFVAEAAAELSRLLEARGIRARVSGRPKHLYSIHNKMRAKGQALDALHDLRGLRVIVDGVTDCYAALDVIHGRWEPQHSEFDDYIVRPKANGYQSLHTVVIADDGQSLEVQVRTQAMHEAAEYGVAAHWRYKERTMPGGGAGRSGGGREPGSGAGGGSGGGSGGGPGPAARGGDGQAARLAWLRQLLAWQQDIGMQLAHEQARTSDDSRIYALTPQGRVIELPAGSTPVDFAYHLHSTLGNACRGAKVDGRLVPLNTPLANGQVVEIQTARGVTDPGPSRDWLNPALGFVKSPRARNKLRQWFNAQERDLEQAAGREKVEKALAREGRSALSLDELASRLGRASATELFADVAREVIGARALEDAIRAAAPAGAASAARTAPIGGVLPDLDQVALRPASRRPDGNPVLVVGVDFLMTQLARCCRPLPPDPIVGFVTRGKGVSVHRDGCTAFRALAERSPERVLAASWGDWQRPAGDRRGPPRERRYPSALVIRAADRPGLLRDVTEVFARERINVLSVRTHTRVEQARLGFVVEVASALVLDKVLAVLRRVPGVEAAERD